MTDIEHSPHLRYTKTRIKDNKHRCCNAWHHFTIEVLKRCSVNDSTRPSFHNQHVWNGSTPLTQPCMTWTHTDVSPQFTEPNLILQRCDTFSKFLELKVKLWAENKLTNIFSHTHTHTRSVSYPLTVIRIPFRRLVSCQTNAWRANQGHG